MTQPAAARQDKNGDRWYSLPDPNGELHDLPSFSRLKDLLHSGGLETYKLKTVARNMALRPDLQMLAGNAETLWEATKEAARDDRKANIGTAAHKLVEEIEAGTLDMDFVPEASKPFVEQYIAAKERHGFKVLRQEFTTVNFTVGYAGTADMLAEVDGELCIVDVKTGANVQREVALQLAGYGNAEFVWRQPADEFPEVVEARAELARNIAEGTNIPPGRRKWSLAAVKAAEDAIDELHWQLLAGYDGREPMPEGLNRDLGYVLHLHADSCDLVPVNLDGAFDVVVALCWVFAWQQRKDIIREPVEAASRPAEPVSDRPAAEELAQSYDEKTAGDAVHPVERAVDRAAVEVMADAAQRSLGGPGAPRPAALDELPSVEQLFTRPQPAPATEAKLVEPVLNEDDVDDLAEPQSPPDSEPVESSAALPEGAITSDTLCEPMPAGHRPRTVDEMLDGELQEWLVERLKHFPRPSVELLVETWPDGIVTFKSARTDGYTHTRSELEQIRRALDQVETAHHLEGIDPMPYLDRKVTVPATEEQAVADLQAAGLTGTVIDGDDAPGNPQPLVDRLKTIASTQPAGRLDLLREHLARAGITKKLQGTDTWTVGELRRYSECIDLVDDSLDPF